MSLEYYLESSVTYKEGDIVWVKLGPTWWPGEVKDLNSLPPEVEFKKPPLVAVQFFDEDAYEYVRSWDNICPYNCDKKVEFIKKGMASFRSNVPHMQKFPKDVSNAEVRVGGNPNILSEPAFIPEKRRNNSDDETPSSKAKKEKKAKVDKTCITHRRFLGFDDYKAYICIQSPEKDRIPGDREDDEVILLNREPDTEYKCYSCCFSTKRLEVFIVHTKFHFSGIIGSKTKTKKKKKPGITKAKNEKPKKPRSSSKTTTPRKRTNNDSSKRRKSKSSTNTSMVIETGDDKQEKPENVTDFRSHLLAEWEDSDDDMDDSFATQVEFTDTSISKNTCDKESDISSQTKDNSDVSSKEDSLTNAPDTTSFSDVLPEEDNFETNDKINKINQDTQQAIKSCFDFDEEDEEEAPVIPASGTGRKIPRVIPIAERRRSSEDLTKSPERENLNKKEDPSEDDENSGKENEVIDKAFHEVMEATSIPELPDISSSLKWEQNFHGTKTIKFPDKEPETTSPTKSVEKPTNDEPAELTTKLINPKKRFVKSFKDFEHKQNLKLHLEKKTKSSIPESGSPDDFQKLKSRILSKIIQQANIGEESKLKIMSKIEKNNDSLQTTSIDDPNSESEHNKEVHLATGEMTKTDIKVYSPRSENSSENSNKEKPEVKPTDSENGSNIIETSHVRARNFEGPASETVTEVLPPKKKLSRRTSHPKKDRTLLKRFEIAQAMEAIDDMAFANITQSDKTKLIDNVENTTEILNSQGKSDQLSSILPSITELYPSTDLNTNSTAKNKVDKSSVPEKINNEDNVVTTDEVPDESKTVENSSSVEDFSHLQKQTTVEETPADPDITTHSDIDPSIVTSSEAESVEQNHEIIAHVPLENTQLQQNGSDLEMNTEPENICSFAEQDDTEKTNNTEQEAVQVNTETDFCENVLEPEILKTPCSIQSLLAAEKEEYDSVGKASIYLPDDAICSPPRKRRQSDSCKSDDLLDTYRLTKKAKKDITSNIEHVSTSETTVNNSQNSENITSEKMDYECEMLSKNNVLVEEVVTECVNHLITKVCESESNGLAVDAFQNEAMANSLNETNEPTIVRTDTEENEEKMELSLPSKSRDGEESDAVSSYGKPQVLSKDENTETLLPERNATEMFNNTDQKLSSDMLQEPEPEKLDNESEMSALSKEEIVTEEIIYFDEEVPLVENVVESTESPIKNTGPTLDNLNDENVNVDKSGTYAGCLENTNTDTEEHRSTEKTAQASTEEHLSEHEKFIEIKTDKIKEVTLGDAELNVVDSIKSVEESELSSSENEFLKTDNQNFSPLETNSEHSKLNQVEVHCTENSLDGFKFSIQTDLSNLSDSKEIIMGLSTLSDIKSGPSSDSDSNTSCIEQNKSQREMYSFKEQTFSQPELVPVEGNLTVVSEKDLADGQVEITPEQVISSKKVSSPTPFYTDFSDSTNDSSSTTDTLSDGSKGFESRGTEFSSRAIMKEVKSTIGNRKSSAYGRTELLDILEGNSDTDKKIKEPFVPQKIVMDDFCDFEDHIPSQIVCAKKLKLEKDELLKEKETITKIKKNSKIASTTNKLLERLTETKKDAQKTFKIEKPEIVLKQHTKTIKSPFSSSKALNLPEQIMKSGTTAQISKPKNLLEDIEDVEAFVIHKDIKKHKSDDEEIQAPEKKRVIEKKPTKTIKQTGKAKILQQTIITASGEIIQPSVPTVQTDENVFDINSMPIVLSDQILTPENIEKMSVVLTSDPQTSRTLDDKTTAPVASKPATGSKVIPKKVGTGPTVPGSPDKPILNQILKSKTSRILQTSSNRVIQKGSPLLPNTSKPGKYILVPQASPAPKGVVKKMVLKKTPVPPSKVIPGSTPEMTGNKIMIVTNQQGQQQRLLLTPAHQKLFGCQTTSSKVTKTIKGNFVQSNTALSKRVVPVSATETTANLGDTFAGQTVLLTSSPVVSEQQVVTPATIPSRIIKTTNKKIQLTTQKSNQNVGKGQTVVIKNQQALRKVQGTDDELEKQVAEQLEAIKASSGMKFESQQTRTVIEPSKTLNKPVAKRLSVKKNDPKSKIISNAMEAKTPKTPEILPRLTMKSPAVKDTAITPKLPETKMQPERPLNQLVIQDAMGIQTTITEGQILALPSETVDGHPQSYMLVTLDKSGNLIPLNNEALMSLDPNLGSCGDISNMVLQIEQGGVQNSNLVQPAPVLKSSKESGIVLQTTAGNKQNIINTNTVESAEFSQLLKPKVTNILPSNQTVEQTNVQPASHEPGQQLIISGDPIATQKFLESLTEGTTDLANLLANAEGNSILIQADGQQILINAESDNQMMLSVNNDNANLHENSESGGNPIFASQPSKSQDILAAALADTDVFQPDQHTSPTKFASQLSPGNSLYPMNVGNVLETSLTLSSPIMTPLEVPSTNSKKIPDEETDILTQVPKNVDLPITITDPNIAQTVSNQHVASLIANELQANLELNLPIPETTMTSVTKHLHSPSYPYSLPALDDPVEITHKTFSSSMPLLNEDADETSGGINRALLDEMNNKNQNLTEQKGGFSKVTSQANKTDEIMNRRNSFLENDDDEEEEEGRFTLGREMCSSLSEPPPEMFDLVEVNSSYVKNSVPSSLQSTPDPSERAKDEETTDLSMQGDSSNDGSCEIPVQPKIIAKSQNLDLLNSD